MTEQTVGFFLSWFASPSPAGIFLAVAFGAVWLAGYWPPLFKDYWLWAVMVAGAFLSLAAVSFVQIPLQALAGQALNHFWSAQVLEKWIMIAAIPQILLSGLVQEGSKLVPVVLWWWRRDVEVDPRLGLAAGAVAGAGFGVFEAVWIHTAIFAGGWNWGLVQGGGLLYLAGFWERFFSVAFHIAATGLAGWGLARGWGWQFYLLAAFLHGLVNYSIVFVRISMFTTIHVEIYLAVVALVVAGGTLWLRWKKRVEAA